MIMINEVELIEEIIKKSETSYESLQNIAWERLGMDSSMKNILISITLRHWIEH
jgi:hypothetical protein